MPNVNNETELCEDTGPAIDARAWAMRWKCAALALVWFFEALTSHSIFSLHNKDMKSIISATWKFARTYCSRRND